MNNCYVLRKDNWEQTTGLYQRLIERDRIQGVRGYLARKQSTFINNIIVGLPDGVSFRNSAGQSVDLKTVSKFGSLQMQLPDEANSICVIDGQHRIFAHYEGIDGHEKVISELRKKLHLLVTGLVYPPEMKSFERRRFESELFLDINSNARPVPSDVLLFIETLKDPFSDIAVARQVLESLNSRAPFENMFQMSLLDSGKIKIASIIKFALRYLVAITADPERATLFSTWGDDHKRAALLAQKELKSDDALLKEYVDHCASHLCVYFGALRQVRLADWNDRESKILSTTSINGFILALRRSLGSTGLRQFEDYVLAFEFLAIDFGRHEFEYASSQYSKFSTKIFAEVFDKMQPSSELS
jgi:DGQHR domain-containing protein